MEKFWGMLGGKICLTLKKVDSKREESTMYQLHTEKQQKYFKEVIRLHYEEGYGENRIVRIIPIGHTTAARWIAIFAREKGKIKGMTDMAKTQEATSVQTDGNDVKELQKKIKELEAQLLAAEVKAEVYDRMIEIAESRFGIPIRKKPGAKQ